ncbi:Kinesin [Hexamita inflata]|uniref:Kinesin n=1 Tax=Hexamita inflata TaxID=28002 RepID=A0ABP1IKD2_9EUKA
MDKISFTVVCEENGKKYKISFKQQAYNLVSIRHIRDHVRKTLQSTVLFELYFNGNLLLDSQFCHELGIQDGSTVIMKLVYARPGYDKQQNFNQFQSEVRKQQEDSLKKQIQRFNLAEDNIPHLTAKRNEIQEADFNEEPEVDLLSQYAKQMSDLDVIGQFNPQKTNYQSQLADTLKSVEQMQVQPNKFMNKSRNDYELQEDQPMDMTSSVQYSTVEVKKTPAKKPPKPRSTEMLLSQVKQPYANDEQIKQMEQFIFEQKLEQERQKELERQKEIENERKIQDLQQQIQNLTKNAQRDTQLDLERKMQEQIDRLKQDYEQKLQQIQITQNQQFTYQQNSQQMIQNQVQTPQMLRINESPVSSGIAHSNQSFNNSLTQNVFSNTAIQQSIMPQPVVQNAPIQPNTQVSTINDSFVPLPVENQKQKQLQKQNKLLAHEIDNLEKVLQLLDNQKQILDQDYQNQKQVHSQAQSTLRTLQSQQSSLDPTKLQNKLFHYKLVRSKQDLIKTTTQLQNFSQNRRKLHNQVEDLKGNIRVFVRVRPHTQLEKKNYEQFQNSFQILSDQNIQFLQQNSSVPTQYKFFRVYNDNASQQTLFNDVKPLIQSALDGYNIFVGGFGNTGSGKTYTILGDDGDSASVDKTQYGRLGVLPRSVVELFKQLNELKSDFQVELAMVELYCDSLIDLLEEGEMENVSANSSMSNLSQNQNEKLQIRKTQNGDTYIKNLSWVRTRTAEELISYLGPGLEKRHISPTALNDRSSRSHTIIYIKLKQKMSSSTLIFADLAGSERVEKSNSTGQRMKEAQYINQSLAALGDVMSALSQKKAFVPYRNNKLTMLLQPGMGGNSKSVLFVCVSPLATCLGESFCSLQFGARAKAVQNVAVKGLYE